VHSRPFPAECPSTLRWKLAELMDLLVSYYWNHFSRARREVVYVLRKFGDPAPKVERTGVIGIAIVHTSLNNREVIQRCKELFKTGFVYRFATKWVPVDFWCETSLDSIKKVIDDNVTNGIGKNETWGMKVEKRRATRASLTSRNDG
jgi:tRNA(Ser,Leu) C12 N-acetylase TAN1